MKKLLLFSLILTLFWACSGDPHKDDDFHFEILPIAEVDAPETLVVDDLNRFSYRYKLPSNCHEFSDLYYVAAGTNRTVAVVALVTDTFGAGLTCQEQDDVVDERIFDFYAAQGAERYSLKFWQGEDENGEDIYLTMNIPVQ
mgnify:CR=1 FL=1